MEWGEEGAPPRIRRTPECGPCAEVRWAAALSARRPRTRAVLSVRHPSVDADIAAAQRTLCAPVTAPGSADGRVFDGVVGYLWGKSMKYTRISMAVASVLAAGALGACGGDDRDATPAAGTAEPTITRTVTQQPEPTETRETQRRPAQPDPDDRGDGGAGSAGSFVDAYESAGITAPPDWAFTTGEQICAEWLQGSPTEETDQILLEGGIYAHHLQTFNDIIEEWLCPGNQP